MSPSYTTLCHPNCFGWNGLPPAYPVPLGLFRLKGSPSYITLRQHDFSAERITLLHDNVASWYPRLQRSPSCISLRHHNFPVGRVIQLHYTVPPSFFGWKGHPAKLHCATMILSYERVTLLRYIVSPWIFWLTDVRSYTTLRYHDLFLLQGPPSYITLRHHGFSIGRVI